VAARRTNTELTPAARRPDERPDGSDRTNGLGLPRLVAVSDIAKAERVDQRTLISDILKGRLKATLIGRRWYTTAEAVREYLVPKLISQMT
jgi:hypothetical protein